jgi:hypothetical protein
VYKKSDMRPIDTHTMFLGKKNPVTTTQLRLYENADAHGFDVLKDGVLDPEHTDATLFLALSQVLDTDNKLCPVYIYVRDEPKSLIHQRVLVIGQAAYRRIEPVDSPKKLAAMKHLQRMLSLLCAGYPFVWGDPPPRWVAFGLSTTDDVPTWIKQGLIPW